MFQKKNYIHRICTTKSIVQFVNEVKFQQLNIPEP